jgi:hypothetical protein
MDKENHGSMIPWVDIYANVAGMMAALFFLTFLLLVSQTKNQNEGAIMPKADFLITLDWNVASDVDIDLWVKDPEGKLVSFVNKSITGMFLDRDDLGYRHDIIKNHDGTETKIEINQEVVTIRGFKPGRYVVNAQYYNSRLERLDSSEKLSIVVIKLQPFGYIFKKSDIEIKGQGSEVTLVSFELDSKGNVINVSTETELFVNGRG